MKVKKKELKERMFTPYEITITIENEVEHMALKKDIREAESSSRRTMDRFRKQTMITDLFNQITSHTK